MLHTPADLAPESGGGRRPAPIRGVVGDAADTGALTLAALLSILRRRRLTLVAAIAVVPLLGLVALRQTTPRYTAAGAVMYEPSSYALQELQSILHVDPTTDAVMASQAEILRGLHAAERVAAEFHLDQDAEFNPALRPPGPLARARAWLAGIVPALAPAAGPGPDRHAVAQAVQDAITVQALRASRVLSVGFTDTDPARAAAIANRLMALYIDDQLEAKFAAVRRAGTWLDTRVGELRREVAGGEDRIAAYRAREGLAQGVQAGLDTEQLSRLSSDLLAARSDLAQAQARLDAASGRSGGAVAAAAAIAPSVVTLRAQQDTLAAQLQSLLVRLGPSHPDVVALRNQLAEVQRAVGAETGRVVAAAEAEVRAGRARVATLEASLRDSQAQLDRNAQAQVPLNAMQREADASRTLLQTVLERIQQTAQQTAIEKPDARVISAALPPAAPSSPRAGLLMGAAAAFGLVFGVLVVYLLELADSTFRSGDDVRALLGLPCLALLPRIPRAALGRGRVVDYAAAKPLSPFAEQLRALRAGLWLGRERPRVLAVTAARPSEGKTTTTLALGRAAAQGGERVLAIDCDIRQPGFGRLMGADGELGVIDCLTGHATAEAAIRRDPLTAMDYLPAGAAEGNSLGLFMSDAMVALLDRLRERYDLILLDAPPAFAMADARVVARLADATLLCVRWRDTPRSVVANSLALLEEAGARIAGACLTRVDAKVHLRSGFSDAEIYHPRYGGYFRD